MGVWVIDVEAWDAADQPVTLRYASGDYTEQDGGNYHYYAVRLVQPAIFNLVAFTGELLPSIGGEASVGSVELLNTDGELDALADYAVDGRSMTLRYIDGGVASQVLAATVERMSFSERRVTLSLRNPLAMLEQPLPGNRYAGDNILPDGVEGTADDIGGTRKPLVFGEVSNASPVLVNTAKLIYQVHDGADITVTEVRDRGVALTFGGDATDLTDLLTTPPAAGEWRRYQGYFALGAAGQAITCDAARTTTLAGSVFAELAALYGLSVPAGDIAALNAVGAAGVYVTEDAAGQELLSQLAQGIGALWWQSDSGDLRASLLAAPKVTPDAVIDDWQITGLARSATGSGGNGLPVSGVTVQADKIETVQEDLAAAAPNQARYASEYREVAAESAATQVRHPLSETITLASALRNMADAGSLAANLLALLSVRRDTVECRVVLSDAELGALTLGATVQLNTSRLGYPRNFVLLGRRPDAKRDRLTLILWG
ncbi:MAG: hypothetical protein CME61_08675 [Halobacteriovoraceae bacterium]|nr:hypothetical protein [Halobacteriovoraceae bacterium]OUX68067.1 MAG: hypothetical protein CBD38_00425 [bacterium TMED178]